MAPPGDAPYLSGMDEGSALTGLDEATAVEPPARRGGISPAALLLLAAWLALGAALALGVGPVGPTVFGFVILGWILAVMAHEFGHAWIAWMAGDHTVAEKGYLTLDPFRYLDSMTSIILPVVVLAIGGIGLPGGAVYLRPDLMRSAAWRSAASLAGPAGTLAVLAVLAVALQGFAGTDVAPPFLAALAFLAFLQATALILNLLPVPGLDGWGVLRPFLPPALDEGVRRIEGLLFIGLILAMLFWPPAGALLFGGAFLLSLALGVPPQWVEAGWGMFQFWR